MPLDRSQHPKILEQSSSVGPKKWKRSANFYAPARGSFLVSKLRSKDPDPRGRSPFVRTNKRSHCHSLDWLGKNVGPEA